MLRWELCASIARSNTLGKEKDRLIYVLLTIALAVLMGVIVIQIRINNGLNRLITLEDKGG